MTALGNPITLSSAGALTRRVSKGAHNLPANGNPSHNRHSRSITVIPAKAGNPTLTPLQPDHPE